MEIYSIDKIKEELDNKDNSEYVHDFLKSMLETSPNNEDYDMFGLDMAFYYFKYIEEKGANVSTMDISELLDSICFPESARLAKNSFRLNYADIKFPSN